MATEAGRMGYCGMNRHDPHPAMDDLDADVNLATFDAPRLDGFVEPGESELTAAREGIAALKRSEEHTSELQSLMRISYAVFCLKKKIKYRQLTKDHKPSTHIKHT